MSVDTGIDYEYCPTIHGTVDAYEPQWRYKHTDGKWRRVPIRTTTYPNGVPYPSFFGGVIETIGLFGESQAQALAWQFCATAEHIGKHIDIRIQKYELVYDIKARKV